MRAVVLAVAVAGAVCASSSPAAARPDGRATAARRDAIIPPALAARLELSPAQRQQIRHIARRTRTEIAGVRRDIAATERSLRREVSSRDPDEDAIAAAIDRISALEAKVRKLRLFAWLRVRALLSRSQRSTLKRAYARRSAREHRPAH